MKSVHEKTSQMKLKSIMCYSVRGDRVRGTKKNKNEAMDRGIYIARGLGEQHINSTEAVKEIRNSVQNGRRVGGEHVQ